MELMEYRVLDALARSLGSTLSIRALAKRVAELHGTGPYANVYHAVQAMKDAGLVHIDEAGRSHTVRLVLAHARDLLAQRDLQRLQALLAAHPRLEPVLESLHQVLFDHGAAGVLLDPERGATANRLGLLVLADAGHEDILARAQACATRHQTIIDVAPVPGEALARLAEAEAWNPAPDWIRRGIACHHPQALWHALRDVTAWPKPAPPPDMDDVLGALAGLGHRELGAPAQQRRVCVEEAATVLIATGEARRLAAAAVILAKNPITPGLFYWLAMRRGIPGEALAVLRLARPQDAAIGLFEAVGVQQASLDEAQIRSALDA